MLFGPCGYEISGEGETAKLEKMKRGWLERGRGKRFPAKRRRLRGFGEGKEGFRRRKRRVERFPARGGCAWWRVEVTSAEDEKKNR